MPAAKKKYEAEWVATVSGIIYMKNKIAPNAKMPPKIRDIQKKAVKMLYFALSESFFIAIFKQFKANLSNLLVLKSKMRAYSLLSVK